jgi:hypothetical protein
MTLSEAVKAELERFKDHALLYIGDLPEVGNLPAGEAQDKFDRLVGGCPGIRCPSCFHQDKCWD